MTDAGLTIDTTAPDQTNAIAWDQGATGSPTADISYFCDTLYRAAWSGFTDPHTGVLRYEFVIASRAQGK